MFVIAVPETADDAFATLADAVVPDLSAAQRVLSL
jgi:hypothetical protein